METNDQETELYGKINFCGTRNNAITEGEKWQTTDNQEMVYCGTTGRSNWMATRFVVFICGLFEMERKTFYFRWMKKSFGWQRYMMGLIDS